MIKLRRIITAMATGDVRVEDWAKIVGRELVTGLLLGSMLSVLAVALAFMIAPSAWAAIVLPITIRCVVVCGTLGFDVAALSFDGWGWTLH
ncbi:MAG: magnesium transporter [Pirellulales bacterium]